MVANARVEENRTGTSDPIIERLLRARNIIISGEVNQKLAASVMAQLLAMSALPSAAPAAPPMIVLSVRDPPTLSWLPSRAPTPAPMTRPVVPSLRRQ